MALNVGYLSSSSEKEADEMYTPYYAVEPLIKYLHQFAFATDKSSSAADLTIWCPCDEEWSAYVNRFEKEGFKVIRSCLKDGQDFLKYEPDQPYDIIITNPPFSIKDQILKRLDQLGKPFAILLPMNSLQGQGRFKVFKQGIQLLAFDKRIGFHVKGNWSSVTEGTPFASAYFCRDFLPKDLIIEELLKFDTPLKTLN